MRCVVGLGNPGIKYAYTRHNIGFIVLDKFAEKHKLNFLPSKKNYYYSEGTIVSSDFFLIKPTTYMNMSGVPVLEFIVANPIEIQDLLVIVDDVNLPIGKIRLRKSGGDGGHNGIKSIIYQLQNDNFPRLRFGIGSDFPKGEMAEFVLDKFQSGEVEIVGKQIDFTVELIEEFVKGGYKSMSDYYAQKSQLNRKNEKKTDDDNQSAQKND